MQIIKVLVSLHSFLQSPVISSETQISSSGPPHHVTPLILTDQVSNPYTVKGKIMICCILFFIMSDSKHLNILRQMARGNRLIQFALSFSVRLIFIRWSNSQTSEGRPLSKQFIL